MVKARSASGFETLCHVVLLKATAPARMLFRTDDACGTSESGLEVILGELAREPLSSSSTAAGRAT